MFENTVPVKKKNARGCNSRMFVGDKKAHNEQKISNTVTGTSGSMAS